MPTTASSYPIYRPAFWLTQVGLPLLAGSLIYALARDLAALQMGHWLSLSYWETSLILPEWVRYNLPDGLWLFAALQAMRGIWQQPLPRAAHIWIITLFGLAFGSEGLQALQLIAGTADWADVAAYAMAGLVWA